MIKRTAVWSLLLALLAFLSTSPARADIVRYYVEFDQTGNVQVGSMLNWNLYAEITGEMIALPGDDDNFGIETLDIGLVNDTGEMMNAGMIDSAFSGYFSNPGTPTAPGELSNITVSLLGYNAGTVVAANPGNGVTLPPILLATGSYQVNTLGMHNLQTSLTTTIPAAPSEYYLDAASTPVAQFTVQQGPAASVNVVAQAVPEPASLAMMGLAACGALGLRRRRKGSQSEQVCSAT